ncbi:hypothetical protein C8J56DRAFT_880732 [Mycena floridula]|nr:hypothetical protein C8J56DRAFT_880732 [Mycena floridula]
MPLATTLSFFLFLFTTVFAATNRTIDDTLGDSLTGVRPVYFPSTIGVWNATCPDCRIIPIPSLAFAGTWTACTATDDIPLATVELSFKGTAIYVFFILANVAPHGVTTLTESSFILDGSLAGNFSHQPVPGLGFQYDQLVFFAQNLANTDHKLVIGASGQDHHVYVNFDYAIYTVPDPVIVRGSSSSTSTVGRASSSIISSASSSFSTSLIQLAHTTFAPTSSLIESEAVTSQPTTSSSIPENSARASSPNGTSSKISPGLIAGITLALIIALALGLFLWFRLERRRARASPLFDASLMSVDPYSISSPRQIELELRMQEIQRQMNDLQYESGGDSPQTQKSRDRERLQAQRLSTEPPPGYSSISK